MCTSPSASVNVNAVQPKLGASIFTGRSGSASFKMASIIV